MYNNLLLSGANSCLLTKNLACNEANRKSQKLSPLAKKTRNLPNSLTLSILQANTDAYANSADPDEMARNCLSLFLS